MKEVILGADFMKEFYKEHPEFVGIDDGLWCEEHDGVESFYHDKNQSFRGMAGKDCPTKHHWHCEQCNKLTQIG